MSTFGETLRLIIPKWHSQVANPEISTGEQRRHPCSGDVPAWLQLHRARQRAPPLHRAFRRRSVAAKTSHHDNPYHGHGSGCKRLLWSCNNDPKLRHQANNAHPTHPLSFDRAPATSGLRNTQREQKEVTTYLEIGYGRKVS